jgi:spore coat protein U-like protein
MMSKFGTSAGRAILRLSMVSGAVLAATPALAETTSANLGVTATVTANCTVSTNPVAFGNVNTLAGTNVDATGDVTVRCTNGTGWSAAANAGSGTGATLATRRMTAGANTLDYALYTDAARTSIWGDGSASSATVTNTGTGAGQTFTIYGRVPSGQAAVRAGSYSDTVSVTVTY